MSKQKVAEGDLFAVPGGEAFGLAKVIFISSHYRNLMLIRLFPERADGPNALPIPDPKARSELCYTGVDSAQKGEWVHVGQQDVTGQERAMTKRVAAREVWIEDTHLGPATEQDMKT